jgi:alpha-tubulin suppressor-like RCC1 family protein
MKCSRTTVRIVLLVAFALFASNPTFKPSANAAAPSTLSTWGTNTFGQLGDGTISPHSLPTVVGSSAWTTIAQGETVSAAIKSDGTLWTWGRNGEGTLGDGTTTDHRVPTQVGSATWLAVAVSNHILGIQSDGSLWAWGRNDSGQLGDGTQTGKSSPVRIGTSTWSSISVHGPKSAAIRSDGALFQWGSVLGPPFFYTVPTQVDKQRWRAVSVGGGHVLAINVDKTLWGWGQNFSSQLGDGTTTDRLNPIQISSAGWSAISAGGDHSAAIRSDGPLVTWGAVGYGDGPFSTISTPPDFGARFPRTSITPPLYEAMERYGHGVQILQAENWVMVYQGEPFRHK